jgi:hypothetical protein
VSSKNTGGRPARVKHWEPAGHDNELWLCEPSWEHGEGEWSLKCGHRDKNGKWAAPGEAPGGDFLLRGVVAAFENGYYGSREIIDHIKDLLEALHDASKSG